MFAKSSAPLVALTLILLSSCATSPEGKSPPGAGPGGSRGGAHGDPVFECDWDNPGSLAADISEGGKEPVKNGNKVSNAVQAEGKSGQGLLCRGKDSAIQYPIKNFNWQAGTIEFWLNTEWYGLSASYDGLPDRRSYSLLEVFSPAQGAAVLRLGATCDACLGFTVEQGWGDHGWKNQVHNVYGGCGDWAPGEWHHVAITWDERESRLYVDGVKQADARKPESKAVLQTAAEGALTLGSNTELGETYDQLRVYNYARPAEQVRQDYQGGADITVEPILPMRDADHMRIPIVVYPDETMALRTSNFSGRDRTVELSWQITDLSQPEFKLKKMGGRKVELRAGGNHVETVYVPKDEMTPYGLFEVSAEVRETGKLLAKRVRTFGAGPRPVDLSKVPDTAFGFGVWNGNWADECAGNAIPTYPPKSVEPLTRLGHNWERVTASWKWIEKEKGKFDWKAIDEVVASAKKKHVNLMPCLIQTPDWATNAPADLTDEKLAAMGIGGRWSFLPKDMKDWDNFVFQIVSRYKGSVKYWNIWNEPCYGYNVAGWDAATNRRIPVGSAGEARLYFDLVKTASLAAKRADPDAKIVIEPCWGSWLDNLMKFDNGELVKLVDVYAWHWYPPKMEDLGPDAEMIRGIRDLTAPVKAKAGAAARIWDTEGCLALAPRRTNRPTSLATLKAEIARNNKAFNWMGWGADEWSHADRTVRYYLLKWGEGVEKVMGGNYDCYSNIAQTIPNTCCWRDGSPVVTALATTVMIRTLDGAEFVRKLDVQEGHYAYLFRKGREHVLVCWTTLDKSTLVLDLRAPSATVMDLLGNSHPEETDKGILTREVTRTPFYVTGISGDVRVLPERLKLALGAPIVAAGGKVSLAVEINNHFDADLKADLSLKLPAGWTCQPTAAKVAAGPKGSFKSVFEITAPTGTADGPCEISAVLAEKGTATVKTAGIMVKTPVSIRKVAKVPVIDGDLAKWRDSSPLMMDRRDQVKVGLVDPNLLIIQPYLKHEDTWKGPKDCSGEIRLGWDEKNLYIAAKVTDNDVMHNKLFFATGDCLELFIDLGAIAHGPGTVSGMGQILQCWFIPPVAGSPQPECGVFQGCAKLVGVQVASKRTADGYTLEIALPWSNVAGFAPAPGAVLCADLAINDADKDYKDGKELKSKIVWHGGGDAYATTANYGIWKLE